jgi:lysophospholipase L1-like esterase
MRSDLWFFTGRNFAVLLLSSLLLACTPPDDHPPDQPGTDAIDYSVKQNWLFLGDSITQAGHYVDYIETWYLLNTENRPLMTDLGLSSETVSNSSEPDHPFARPWLHSRLDDVLVRVRPDLVIACYGMNDAIYHPFSAARFSDYQTGIRRLIDATKAIGADIILLTPPPYAGRVSPKPAPATGEAYSYKKPYPGYNDVLQQYAEWILSLDTEEGVMAIDIRPALETHMAESYPKEPVHPNVYGHKVMAEVFLQDLGLDTGSDLLETGVNPRLNDSQWGEMLELIRQQREIYDRALLNDIGHGNPRVRKRFTTSIEDAEALVELVNAKIEEKLVLSVNP